MTFILFFFLSAFKDNLNLSMYCLSTHLLFILHLALPLIICLLPCQFANLFLLRLPLTSLSLNVTSNYQLYLIWSLISTDLFHWLTGHRQSPLFPSTFMNLLHRLCCCLLFLCPAVLQFSGFYSKPLFFHVTYLPIKSHPLLRLHYLSHSRDPNFNCLLYNKPLQNLVA